MSGRRVSIYFGSPDDPPSITDVFLAVVATAVGVYGLVLAGALLFGVSH